MRYFFATLVVLTLGTVALAQNHQNPWTDTPESAFARKTDVRRIVPREYRTLSLDLGLLKQRLHEAPLRFTPEAEAWQPTLAIPMPDGSTLHFRVVEAPVMHPDLAARYPYMRSYAGWSDADRTAYLRCGYTQKGFHGMVLSAVYGTVYIDIFAEGDDQHYISYFKKDCPNIHQFECHVETPNNFGPQSSFANPQSTAVGDCQHRNYALALACTGEYAAFHGGTKPLVLAEYNVAMNRLNGIYEREFAVNMTMVANTDLLIFLNAATDPYTNNNGGTMLNENQTTCNNVIGNANYDIGHVFSTGGGGIAQLNAVCNSSGKARGVTGLPNPIGDPFYVDYVAHEMGHQFGGNHTQNNDCNRNGATAMEPGSASTIMGYAGICAPDVQNNSDDYFHAINLVEIHNHILGAGNSCATTTPSGNNAPTISVPAASYNLPISTPFVLTAQGQDADANDQLTYCWEQMNNQVATMPPLASNTQGPAFRSLDPMTSPSRYFPNLAAILAGTTPTWEVLPSVSRTMAFRCTVRDNHPLSGCSAETNVNLTFTSSAGPFVVTNPNTSSVVWTGGSTATVAWNVANTNLPPISTSQVEILLSADGGLTYPYTLQSTTNNDGTETVLVPNIATTTARVMVKAKNNVYFDISNQNFTIQMAVVPSFVLTSTPDTASACQSGTANFSYDMLQLAGFNNAVNFTASGLPVGATAIFTPNNVAPPATVSLAVGSLGGVPPGTYPFSVTAVGGTVTQTDNLVLVVLNQVTSAATLSTPSDGAEVTSFQPTLTWLAVPNATSYFVEVSESPSFSPLFASGNATTNSFQVPTPLAQLGVYYWRVTATNPCSAGIPSATFAFHVGGEGCQTYNATGLPLTIPTVASTVTKTLNVPTSQSVISVQTSVNIDHTYIGDLSVELVSPSGTTRKVFDRPGVPASSFGCAGDDIIASFADSYTNTAAMFESTCAGNPAISGNYQPLEAFSSFAGQNSQGNWQLKITDSYDDDGGALLTWSLQICGLVPSPPGTLFENNVLTVPQGLSAVINETHLLAYVGPTGEASFIVTSLPANGTLLYFGAPLGIGGIFTQDDLFDGDLIYQHDGSMTTSDHFTFDLLDGNGYWLPNQTFNINILENTLAASAAVTQSVTCFGEDTGEITVTASGGSAPLEYSLNGGPFQGSNVFGNLAPGDYTVEVQDADGFIVTTATVSISAVPTLDVSATVTTDDISVTASGGTGMLQYSIGGPFQNGSMFTNVTNGTYTVTVQDENGCTATTTATVSVNTLSVNAAATSSISCFGEADGEITVSVAGGNPPYQYSLNGGPLQNENTFGNLAPGDYTVEVLDADGFMLASNTVTLTEPTQLSASASAAGNTITVTATGGTGGLQYSLNGGPFQGSNTFGNLSNGTYTITVQDENGCTTTATATVSVNSIVVSATASGTLNCFGDTDGFIMASATGGNDPYQYSLNGGPYQGSNLFTGLGAGNYTISVLDGDGLTQTSQQVTITAPPQITGSASASGYTVTATVTGGSGLLQYSLDGGVFQSGNLFFPVANGSHTVTVRDTNDCEATFSVTVNVQTLGVSGSVTQPLLCPGAANGAITAVGMGGVPAYQYSLNGGPFQSGATFGNLAAGAYTLTIQDSGGFTVSSSNIVLAAPPAISVAPTATGTTVTVVASGGTGPYQYQLDGGPLQSSNTFSNVANGTHTVTVVDANGCASSASVFVGGLPPNIFVSISQPVSCHGGSDAVITAGASGGTPPYQFSLNGGPFQNGDTFSNLAAGTYTVTVMGSNGATITSPNIVIVDPPALSVSATVSGLTITANGSGGTGTLEYSLDGVNFDNDNELTAPANGTYTVTVRDENGCKATTSVNVNAVVGVTLEVTYVSCFGETDGEINVQNVTGGTPPYLYSLNGGPFTSQVLYTGLAAGDYIIQVQDATGYVFEAPNVVIEEPAELSIDYLFALNDLTIVAGGGTTPYMYSIDGGVTFQSSPAFNDLAPGTYELVIKDANGCLTDAGLVVTVSPTNDLAGSFGFEVMPNPSAGLFNLKMELAGFAKLELEVFDVVGKRVFASQNEAVGTALLPLDLQYLPSGSYLLRVRNGELWGVRKLVLLK